jgi:hypothetical protein
MNNIFIVCKDKKTEVISKLLEYGYDGSLLTEYGFKESRIVSSYEAFLERSIIMIGDNNKLLMVLQKDYNEMNSSTIAKEFTKYTDEEFLDIPLSITANDLRNMLFSSLTSNQLLKIDETINDILVNVIKNKDNFYLEYGNNQIQTFNKIMLKKLEYMLIDLGYNINHCINYGIRKMEITW